MSSSYARFKCLSATTCALLLSAASAFSQGNPLPPAKNVDSVWNVTGQPCGGNRGSQMRYHKDEASIKQSRLIELPSIGMSLTIPQLPDYSDTVVKLVLDDRSRGVVDHYILLAKDFIDAPFAAIAITELPPQLDTASKAFGAAVEMERRMAAPAGVEPTFQRIAGPFGEGLETITPGRISSQCFPTANWRLAEGGAKDSTLGISRFVLIDNKLVEFTLILKVGPQRSSSDQAAYARKIMDRFWLALNVRGADGRTPEKP